MRAAKSSMMCFTVKTINDPDNALLVQGMSFSPVPSIERVSTRVFCNATLNSKNHLKLLYDTGAQVSVMSGRSFLVAMRAGNVFALTRGVRYPVA
jgi:hypothetical protein